MPIKNIILDKIQSKGTLTDVELQTMLTKSKVEITHSSFEKVLSDLEIMGLISVTWLSKDTRRIEIIMLDEKDIVEEKNKEMMEKDYEVSFPHAD